MDAAVSLKESCVPWNVARLELFETESRSDVSRAALSLGSGPDLSPVCTFIVYTRVQEVRSARAAPYRRTVLSRYIQDG